MERTLIILKPDAVQRGLCGQIIDRFEKKGLQIVGMKLMKIPRSLAQKHYEPHQGKPFYEPLVNFMTSSPVIVMAIHGKDAITVARKMMGATFGSKAEPGSIRGDFGVSNAFNLIHGSDSPESARRELGLFFKPEELLEWTPAIQSWVYDMTKGAPRVIQAAIGQIHASEHQLVLEFTGAGSAGLAALHGEPGSSRTILEATDRYSAASLAELLGVTLPKAVDLQTASAMADRAYLRACRLGVDAKPKLGVGCTATIATDRAKRGDHRACVSVRDHLGFTTLDLTLTKGARDRSGEESIVTSLLIDAIAQVCGTSRPPVNLLEGEQIHAEKITQPDPIEQLLAGSVGSALIEPDGRRLADQPVAGVIYAGSFNPLHYGHEALAAAAARCTGLQVTFELTAINADKAPLGRGELENRLSQFWRTNRVVVTRAALFADKALLFPGCTFVLGYDTAARLVDPRFYDGSHAKRDEALLAMLSAGCRILVAGRLEAGKFKTLAELSVAPLAKDLFFDLPDFRADISATDLRTK